MDTLEVGVVGPAEALGQVPYQTNREWKARSTDPSTWNTFDAVRTAYQRGGFDGVGFVLSANDPFVFVDLDHVVVDGDLEPWAQELVDHAGSYHEWSIRGEGVHILVEGVLPDGKGHQGLA